MDFFYEANDAYSKKNYNEAIHLYKKSIDENKYIPSCYYNVAVCLIKQKKFLDAILVLKKSLTLSLDSKYFFNLAYCYFELDDYQNALRLFNISWALNPNDSDCEKAINIIMHSIRKKKFKR